MESRDLKILLKLEDNISTDHIIPTNNKVYPFRTHQNCISELCFSEFNAKFPIYCKENDGGLVVAGENYGFGPRQKEVAEALRLLGINVIIAKSFAKEHKRSLAESGILPLIFADRRDYADMRLFDEIKIKDKGSSIYAVNKLTLRNIKLIIDV